MVDKSISIHYKEDRMCYIHPIAEQVLLPFAERVLLPFAERVLLPLHQRNPTLAKALLLPSPSIVVGGETCMSAFVFVSVSCLRSKCVCVCLFAFLCSDKKKR